MSETVTTAWGKVYLVGAGPGDPGLITVRGLRCLQRADVILHDYLVDPRILTLARAGAETICLDRQERSRLGSQEEINARVIQWAREGRTVVRLKSGDPAVFARGADEIEPLVTAGISFEVVPGITAGLAVGSYTGIPVTHRGLSSAVALVTGHEDDDKAGRSLDYEALARFPGTLVYYMGVTSARHWTAALVAAGKSADTPAAIVRRCTCPDQTLVLCSLGEVAERLERAAVSPPVVVVVGDAVRLAPTLDWFNRRPLFGRRVLVTRAAGQASKLAELLEDQGAEVLRQPAIEIGPPADWGAVDRALAQLSQFDWLVFSSSNGVRFLLERLFASGRDLRALGRVRVAAIGPGTAEELTHFHLRADLQPDSFRAESLAAALAPQARGRQFLLARASRGREVLADELRRAGGHVQQVVVYSSTDCPTPEPGIKQQLGEGQIHFVTVTSSAIANSLSRLFGDRLCNARLVSISPVTSDALRACGLSPSIEATTYTMEGVVEAILQAVREESRPDKQPLGL